MEDRNTCWLRPLSLCIEEHIKDSANEPATVIDLRNGPDVICAWDFVQLALDSDWICLLERMAVSKEPCNFSQANLHLRQFLQALLQ